MLFLRSPRCMWFWMYNTKSTKMVDYQTNLEAWLQDASLFRNEPVDYAINFEYLLCNEKASTEGDQAILGLSDLGWLDEKVDLSILDNPNGLLNHHHEANMSSMEDDAAFLLGLMDGSLNPSDLPSDALKLTDFDLGECLLSPSFSEPTSSENFDSHLASPSCTAVQVDSPAFYLAQSPVSPAYSDISEAADDNSINYVQPPPKITSDAEVNSLDSTEIRVSVYNSPASCSSSSDEIMSIDDVSKCVRKRKFVSSGDDIPKVKVILRELELDPPEDKKVPKKLKPKDRRERKKVQNKEAAARYRIKKRDEENKLSDEVADLESTQKKLQEKHDSLKSEIKYLKSLMCEILQKKGIMK